MRRPWQALGVCAAIVVAAQPFASAAPTPPPPGVIDLHVDLSYRVNYGGGTLAGGSGQLVAAESPMVTGVVLPLFVPQRVSPTGPRMKDLEASYARIQPLLEKAGYSPFHGCKPPDSYRKWTWFAFEGSAPLATEEGAVERWIQRGARIFGLVHTTDNALATSSTNKDPKATGLTELGRSFVKKVHAAGGVIDVSHASDATVADVIAIATEDHVPVVATHSNARALAPHPRNLTDDQIRAIAKTGGIIGVNFHSSFLVPKGRATVDDVVAHMNHMIRIGGYGAVAIGSDFEGDITPPIGLESAKQYPNLVQAMKKGGLGRGYVDAVFGYNARRILCPAPRQQ